MSVLHSRQTTAQGIHVVVAFEFANATDRAAGTVANPSGYVITALDVGKIGKQTDTSSYWILNSVAPLVWVQVGALGGIVPAGRNLTAGAGLTGGGDLSADRTFDVVANVDGSITVNANDIQVGILASDTQHGARGGGTQHAVVIAGGANGFMSGADKTKLDGFPANVPDGAFVFGAANVGTSTTARYLAPGYTPNGASVTRMAFRVPRAGTLQNLRVRHNAVGVGGTITYTVRINGVNSTLTVAPLASSVGGSDTSHTPSVAADDLLEIYVTKGASITTSPGDVTAAVEFNG